VFANRTNGIWGMMAGLLALAGFIATGTSAADPIRIGFGMALTGPLAPNGKSALLAMKIWEQDVNAAGGLLGRPVELVYYDDKSSPSEVPALYTKLLAIDKVDIVVGGYATNMLAPAMPIVIQSNRLFIGLFGLAVNKEFDYPKYFSMIPVGPDPKISFTKGFYELAMAQTPKPQTAAIVGADAEFSHNAADGAREAAKARGLKIVYDRTYPPATTDFAPIVRAIQATNPDLAVVCSYPLDSVGMVQAINETGFKPKMLGGAMVGLQATVLKTKLGPLLNGIVNYDFWLPVKTMEFPGVGELIKKYQDRAASEGVDPLGYYMAPFGYASLQVLAQAIGGTRSLNDDQLADYIRRNTFKTVVGEVKFGKGGEWAESRILQVQFQNIKGNGLEQFKDLSTQIILSPPQYKTGDLIYPYARAKR
jgi:branched-chain amino acid transport system substrate-binding protein